MTQKAKCPAEAATSTPGGIETSPDTKEFNMDTNNTQSAEAASLMKVNHLAKEMSAALDHVDGYHVVIVHPSASGSYPVQICLDKEFADLLQSVIELRKGAEHAKPCC